MPTEITPARNRRAVKILFDTYWTPTGWRDGYSTPPDDLEYAKSAGVMFDTVCLSHENIVERAFAAVRSVDRTRVADAFVASLSSRRLELRSALGSFAVMQHLPRHDAPTVRGACPVCSVHDRPFEPNDLNVLNFERLKWGGVRHSQPLYAALDIQLFARIEVPTPSRDDLRLLRAILEAIETAPPNTSSASLQTRLAKAFNSNKAERDVLIGILGVCGVLGTAGHPGYIRQFVPVSARELPPRRFVDMAYPACWWTAADGVSEEAVAYWFGHLM